ncbi:hypothetical protein NW762_014572 [Fusarium torreyae]|uniref:C2H2-type domain-containing protein n=1 Tax=Fusarium torreyae TaxID=1237075 RepID=A0A9W8RLD8_9HYPO|nr:hypothetical protein NW762_014572 [Fusarium torreyae]
MLSATVEMQAEANLSFDMDDNSSIDSQAGPSPTVATNFPFYLSPWNSVSPISSRSSLQDLSPGTFDSPSSVGPFWIDMASPASTLMLSPTESEPSQMLLPSGLNAPIKREHLDSRYNHASDTDIMPHSPPNSLALLGPPPAYGYFSNTYMGTPFMMPSTQSLSGSDTTGALSSWSCTDESPNPFTPDKQVFDDSDFSDLDDCPQSPLSAYSLQSSKSTYQMQPQRQKLVHKAPETPRAPSQSSETQTLKLMTAEVSITRRAIYSCSYSGCDKAFRRSEHLKRHKQTFHGEGPNRFLCEFCGKDQFNRSDNLQVHRRLHARRHSGNRAVPFIPSAVPVIEQEEQTRKRRAPSNFRKAKAQGLAKQVLGN